MAQRFHFDLINGHDTIRDTEGVEADDFDEALRQAWTVIEEMRAQGELSDLAGTWQLMVRSADGTILATVPLM
ncbi:hypothetical protein OPKNFCMD_1987 [Methylobacterium crusticola]|uniref:DUF6894 domain-containing protein n=1 Tax=Methylobacterium crusticola TaxID=1697972 RepID=A0ABQ4QV71_9HYPH|nr:hypothetical protein [Methylobacterium crusticola]GJD49257.1 hypothetical protein OPKNFCMD_1987 [Methylobacterium crusticola]